MSNGSVKDILKDKKKVRFVAESAFKQVDKDGSGYLERPELEEVMNNVAADLGVEVSITSITLQPPTSEEIDEVLKELDENGDGKLSIDEFQVLIEQVLEMMAKVEG
ncbi:unnamed protein product (macronuclear) [Paramecium tetraurelia]|uniref:EF-hand domain-containing protein n=1 Tax=Paramecium tetraurelia TaxID=5888 RepID=A0CTD7_PARTE|nr:uncharacterized protein GSPATT00010288001 [Paramecium tetraurelia]CAK74054.1 unnamed protein product [Paramecium tetraurelia]|eukprot:XP_001441451.1 hypothetical protein (macronuclear) [Paramecium tetraurelia strain d4-2]